MKRAHIALLLALLPCVLTRLHRPIPDLKLNDFQVYYVSALLVHAGDGPRLYAGADTGHDPQKQTAPAASPMAITGRSLGLPSIQLYLYPPLLADLLLPLAHTDLRSATAVWLVLNLLLILLTAGCLAIALRVPLLSWGSAILLVALLCFTPVVSCFSWGQITIFLLFLWAFGTATYARGYPVWSGIAFALATAIKLTPLLIVFPFLIWHEWRWLRAFTVALVGAFLATALVNTPASLRVYFGKVVPAMSQALPDLSNLSIVAAIELLFTSAQGHAVYPPPLSVPHSAMLSGKFVSSVFLVILLVLLLRLGRRLAFSDRVLTIALLSLVAPIISPVSWLHAYAVTLVALAFLWAEALRSELSTAYLACLTLVSVLLSSYLPSLLFTHLVRGGRHSVLASLLLLAELLLWFGMVCYRLSRMRPDAQLSREPALA